MVRTDWISNKKQQSIITLRRVSQSGKIQKVSSSAVTKTIKRYDETSSHEDRHRNGRPKVTSAAEVELELPASEMAAQINASEFK